MDITIYPSKPHGSVHIPSSKSIAHRSIICAGLANGKSSLFNIDISKDISATINAMKTLGAKIEHIDNQLDITGINSSNLMDNVFIDCLESASTLRFIIPLLSLFSNYTTLTGANSLFKRPHYYYKDILQNNGVNFNLLQNKITLSGRLLSGDFFIKENISSQFISGLLFALPLLKTHSNIFINPLLESKPYIKLTMETLSDFGVNSYYKDACSINIPGGQKYLPTSHTIESDFSQAAFFLVLGSLIGNISCKGLNMNSSQGDKAILNFLDQFGAERITSYEGIITPNKSILSGTNIDVANCPDLAPILAVIASFANNKTTIYNASRLAIKESNRLYSITNELKKFGVNITNDNSSITIYGSNNNSNNHIIVDSHNDHRIAMSLSIFTVSSNRKSTIKNISCISKSYPKFFDDLKMLGIQFVYHD